MSRESIKEKRRWVVKVGSALLTNDGEGLNEKLIKQLAKQISDLRASGREVILVSSGAVAAGVKHLGMIRRPERVNEFCLLYTI